MNHTSLCPIYGGPLPSSISVEWPNNTDEIIICLVDGSQRKKLEKGYLAKYGIDRAEYSRMFPGAPFISNECRAKYASVTENRRLARKQCMSALNASESFQEFRQEGVAKFWAEERSNDFRAQLSAKAKMQHKNGLADYIHRYEPYKNTHLHVMSSYERHFLDWYDEAGFSFDRIKDGPYLSGSGLVYRSDYLYDNRAIIEIKSSWIEKLQEKKSPGCLLAKQEIVKDSGYDFVYLKDRDYAPFSDYVKSFTSL